MLGRILESANLFAHKSALAHLEMMITTNISFANPIYSIYIHQQDLV